MVFPDDQIPQFPDSDKNQNSSELPRPEKERPVREAHKIAAKRNCGRTGPTSAEGKAIVSRNALRHGCCAKTIILDKENLDDWIKLCARWEARFPSEDPLLQDFILKTTQAEWERIRVTNFFNEQYADFDLWALEAANEEIKKDYALRHRYKVAAERAFQREFRMLDHFYRTYCEPKKSKEKGKEPEPEPEDDKPVHDPGKHTLRIYNAETGEFLIAGEAPPVIHPPDPGWVPRKIIPGQFYPDHPSNWKYPGNPKHRFTKDKEKWSTEPQS